MRIQKHVVNGIGITDRAIKVHILLKLERILQVLGLPFFSARHFIETTSDPDPASLMARAPIVLPAIN